MHHKQVTFYVTYHVTTLFGPHRRGGRVYVPKNNKTSGGVEGVTREGHEGPMEKMEKMESWKSWKRWKKLAGTPGLPSKLFSFGHREVAHTRLGPPKVPQPGVDLVNMGAPP